MDFWNRYLRELAPEQNVNAVVDSVDAQAVLDVGHEVADVGDERSLVESRLGSDI